MGTLGTYQDKWGYIRNRLEAEIDAISEHALAETDQYMKRREEIEEFLEKTGDEVVADLTTADTGFSVYDEMKSKLIDMGIPEGEIRFIHDANSDPKKQELFDLVNAGKVRVLIGSSMKMGASTSSLAAICSMRRSCAFRNPARNFWLSTRAAAHSRRVSRLSFDISRENRATGFCAFVAT